MRSHPTTISLVVALGLFGCGYVPTKREKPWCAHTVLRNLARGHALIHDRSQLTNADLPLVARIAVDTMPSEFSRVFKAVVASGEEEEEESEDESIHTP